MKIGLDMLGGDFAPEATCLGALMALQELPEDVTIVLFGDEEQFHPFAKEFNYDHSRIQFVQSTEVIGMSEHPTKAFSKKPNSTIGLGFQHLKAGEIDAFASTGNTGAMLVGAMYTVRSVPGVIRPCIMSALPKEGGGVNILLDVGTNADCKPDVLYQFGILGSLFAQYVYNIENPRVGLLNIGEEPGKGNLLTLAAHEQMSGTTDYNFIGNVEGRDVFSDKVDVIVCDGYTGNIVLKEAEAFYSLVKKRNINDEYFDRFNYEIYGGTPILGVNSNVVIGHGISSPLAIKNMLLLTKDVVESGLSEKIKKAFS